MAADEGIPLATAREALEEQGHIPLLLRGAEITLGNDAYGGVWVDDTNTINLAVSAGDDDYVSPEEAQEARDAIAGAGLAGDVIVEAVEHSEAELEALQGELIEQLKTINANPETTIDVAINPVLNTIELEIPQLDRTQQQQDWLEETRARYGDMLSEIDKKGGLEPLGCANGYCDSPLRGGIRIDYSGGSSCTAGFLLMYPGDPNRLSLSTAGHCLMSQSFVWTTKNTNGATKTIGSRVTAVNDARGDLV